MDSKVQPYIVYVKTNTNNYITDINSSVYIKDISDWLPIDSGFDLEYIHAQNNYFPKPIVITNEVYQYKLVDNTPVECSEEEIALQLNINNFQQEPSQLDIIEAQVTYTAMMTDTLLEV